MPKAIYKILVVDDDKMMRDLLTDRLSREPIFRVFTATNGQEGMKSVVSEMPDIILLDVQMPVMDGLEMFRQLKKDPAAKDIPVIFLTNYDTDERMLQDISEGKPAFYFIKSNITLDEVANKIKETLHI